MVTITYNHISEGENKGKIQILADNKPLEITDYANSGISTSWQENTLSKVQDIAKKHFTEFKLPYYVDGGGYVFCEKENLVSKQNLIGNLWGRFTNEMLASIYNCRQLDYSEKVKFLMNPSPEFLSACKRANFNTKEIAAVLNEVQSEVFFPAM